MTNNTARLPETAAFAPMDAHCIIKVGGPDAAALLQGQLSNDIATLDETPGQLSSFNSPKGRVLAFLRVLKAGDAYWLVVDRNIADAFVQRLKMFVLRSKVDIEPADELQGVVATGPQLEERLAAENLSVPTPGGAITRGERILLGIPGPLPRVEIYGPKQTLPETDASADDLARWDILFRLPRINDANRDAHVAQHLNLDELGAINFKKGCYTGQEIIARMKYLGKVKKRASAFFGNDTKPGDSIRTEDDRSVGEVVNVAPAGDRQLILAVVNLDARDRTLSINGKAIEQLER